MYTKLIIQNGSIPNDYKLLWHWDDILDDLICKVKDKNFENMLIPYQEISNIKRNSGEPYTEGDLMIIEGFLRNYNIEFEKISTTKMPE